MEHLQQFLRNVVTGLPQLRQIPAQSKTLLAEGLNIKDHYKDIISESPLGLLGKVSALKTIGVNMMNMLRLAKQVKGNVKKITKYMGNIKEAQKSVNYVELQDIGRKC